MKPIKFKECNITFAENQPEYNPLPAFVDDNGKAISCWKPSMKERIKILFTGKVWVSILTFNDPIQPQLLQIDYPFRRKRNMKTYPETIYKIYKKRLFHTFYGLDLEFRNNLTFGLFKCQTFRGLHISIHLGFISIHFWRVK